MNKKIITEEQFSVFLLEDTGEEREMPCMWKNFKYAGYAVDRCSAGTVVKFWPIKKVLELLNINRNTSL